MANNAGWILPFLLAADLLIPFLLAPAYHGYRHHIQVMSVLGNAKAPFRLLYKIWLVALGFLLLICDFEIYHLVAEQSAFLAAVLFAVVAVYAAGACILAGFFSVGETKQMNTRKEKVHGYGSAIGFLFLTFAPLLVSLYFFQTNYAVWGVASLVCFLLAVLFFTLFILADKPSYQGTVVAWEGLWQRLSLLCMYLPLAFLCLTVH